MHASGFLIPPFETRNSEQINLWNTTFERISPFLPNLRDDLFPPPKLIVPFIEPAVENEPKEKLVEEVLQ